MTHLPPTEAQLRYVAALRYALHLPQHMLDGYCVQCFGGPLATCNRAQVSHVIDTLKAWQEVPADMQREMGWQDLPGMEVR